MFKTFHLEGCYIENNFIQAEVTPLRTNQTKIRDKVSIKCRSFIVIFEASRSYFVANSRFFLITVVIKKIREKYKSILNEYQSIRITHTMSFYVTTSNPPSKLECHFL